MFKEKLSSVFFLCAIVFCLYSCPAYAALTTFQISEEAAEDAKIAPERTWLRNFNQGREKFAEKYGTRFAFIANYTQQAILKARRDVGNSRGAWYWNFGVSQELWKGGRAFIELEVDKNKGIDKFIPTFSLFNSNAGENASPYIPRFYLEQEIMEDKALVEAGKLDLSDWFDTNSVANSADVQFLSDALVNNLAIPFPAKGIGAMLNIKPYKWLYLQAGASTADAVSTKVGLSNAFNSTFFISEIGVTPKIGPLQGNYRFIFYLNREEIDFINEDETRKSSRGFALSFDQEIAERVTVFARYGFANPKVRDIQYFWSAGAQMTEPIRGRPFDCIGIGVAQSIMGDDYRLAYEPDAARSEVMYEVYYRYSPDDIWTFTPSIQVVENPGADKREETVIVCGLRVLCSF